MGKMAGNFLRKLYWTFLSTSSMTSLSRMGLSMDYQSSMKMLWTIPRCPINLGKRIRWQSTTLFLLWAFHSSTSQEQLPPRPFTKDWVTRSWWKLIPKLLMLLTLTRFPARSVKLLLVMTQDVSFYRYSRFTLSNPQCSGQKSHREQSKEWMSQMKNGTSMLRRMDSLRESRGSNLWKDHPLSSNYKNK